MFSIDDARAKAGISTGKARVAIYLGGPGPCGMLPLKKYWDRFWRAFIGKKHIIF